MPRGKKKPETEIEEKEISEEIEEAAPTQEKATEKPKDSAKKKGKAKPKAKEAEEIEEAEEEAAEETEEAEEDTSIEEEIIEIGEKKEEIGKKLKEIPTVEEEIGEVLEERLYTVPLGRALIARHKKRTPRAIHMLQEFVLRHMKAETIAIDPVLNEIMWKRGIEKPPRKIRIRVTKDREGLCTVYQAE